MKVDVVADVGNSRIKWGLCVEQGMRARASLAPDDPAAWEKQISDWRLTGSLIWAIGSVHPGNLEVLTDWLQSRGDKVGLLARHDLLPLEIRVDFPERVGVDRLLNAVAANSFFLRGRKSRRAKAAVVIDAGTAVTVDLLGPDGAFEGGAIFPGRQLMAAALHDYTAQLPLVASPKRTPPPVGANTVAAVEAGIHHAVAGGINQLISWQLGENFPPEKRRAQPFGFPSGGDAGLLRDPTFRPPQRRQIIFLTGGDAGLLWESVDERACLWPDMTLEGLCMSAWDFPPCGR
jgi:type III pantothenate kinase